MQSVLTLIRGVEPDTISDLNDAIVGEVRAALNGLGAETGAPDWLAPGTACDLAFDNIS
jgi:phosphoserine phosphatase